MWADEVTLKYSGSTTTNMKADGSNEAATVGLDENVWSVVASKGAATNAPGLNKAGDIRLYWNTDGSNTITVSSLTNATISSIAITFTGDAYNNVSVTVGGNDVSGTDGVYNINSTSFVLGNANTSNAQVRISQIVITFNAGEGPVTPTCATPTFSPAAGAVESGTTVTISTTTDGADIYYTMGDNPADPTTGSAKYTAPIEITAATTIKAIAVKDGSNNSAIASASYTIISQQNISDITAVGTAYAVAGTVVATNAKGFVIGDGTGYVYTYLNAAPTVAVGDKVSISGTTGSYGQIIQFTSTATIKETATSNYDGTPAVTVVDADGIAAYNNDQVFKLSDYVQFEGVLAKNGNNYNITVGTATARISYPTDDQKATLNALDGKTVRVKGYFAGFSGTTFTAMLESVEALAVPTITANNVTIEAETTSGEIAYTVENPTGATLSAALTDGDWISNIAVDADKVTFDATANTGDERTATITLSYTGAANKVVTVTQKKYVPAATLPFAFDGGSADIATTDGLSQTGVGSYGSSPKLKFDTANDELVLKIGTAASVLNFDIKGNGSGNTPWAGVFKVQTSADGVSYTDLATYTDANLTSTISHESLALASSVRYIKWIYTEKTTGNVALGRIGVDCELVTVPAIGYMTVCYPSNVDLAGTGVKAYVVSEIGATYVELVEIESVPANTPVILEASEGSYVLNYTASPAAVGTNLLQASDGTATTDDATIVYALASKDAVGFYKVKKGITVPAGKAYLTVPVATSAPDFLGFGGATDINVVKGEEFMVNGEIYNLNGQRVAQPTKGLYIVNGKKVVIK